LSESYISDGAPGENGGRVREACAQRGRRTEKKVTEVNDLLQTLQELVIVLGRLLSELLQPILASSLLIAWLAWWLWGVNWTKTWRVLAQGAWAPVVLLMIASALVWSQMAPSDCSCLGLVTVANFWWQLGAVGLLVAVTLLCGWLQGVFGWAPAEVSLDPPATAPFHDGQGHH
jgi:hypothetical protein